MANTTSSPPQSSWFRQIILFLASLGVVIVVYLFRRKSIQQLPEELPIGLNSAEMQADHPADALASEGIQKTVMLKGWQQSAVLLLTFVYGFALLFIYNVDPQLSRSFVVLTVTAIIGFLIWKQHRALIVFLHIFKDLITFPNRFYEAGQPKPLFAPANSAVSFVLSGIFLCGLITALLLSQALPLLALIIVLASIMLAAYGWLASYDVLIIERRFVAIISAVPAVDTATLPRLRWWLFLAEMSVIVLTTVLTTQPFYESPPSWQLSGSEAEWLTSTIRAAHTGLEEYGRIPRWQPYIAHGEPTIENPFNFIFNPFAAMPSLILGAEKGLRISVILCYFMAGLGGWFLGRVVGFGALGRVLLATILMGKGNIHAALNSSYYQLALSQIYMPWAIGGVIAVVRFPKQRWPIVLTALALTLQLFNGNLWYVLPTAVGAFITALVCAFGVDNWQINWQALRRYVVTGVLAIGLSAIIALPVLLQFNRVGKHDEELEAGWVTPMSDVLPLFFDPGRDRTVSFYEPVYGRTSIHYIGDVDEFYFSYIIPGWYVLLILFALPLYRPVGRRDRMIGLAALGLFVLATLWGAGGRQPFLWLYETFAALRQWRFVPRALAVASFWLALLVAMRTDHLWNNIQTANWAQLLKMKADRRFVKTLPILLSVILIVTTGLAAAQVNDQWYQYQNIMQEPDAVSDECTTWLRSQFPTEQLSVWQQNYASIITFLNNRVRSWHISAAFEMTPQPSTIGPIWLDLNGVLPTFAEFANQDQRRWGRTNGYWIIRESPKLADGIPCLSRRIGAVLPYAYSIPLNYFEALPRPKYAHPVNVSAFVPIHLVEQRTDQVALVVTAKRLTPLVVGVQESAYPGWRVEVDGQPAKIESVGGQIGVVLPAGEKPVQVYFVYAPNQPVIGGMITLATALLCIVYLLNLRQYWARLSASVKKRPTDI